MHALEQEATMEQYAVSLAWVVTALAAAPCARAADIHVPGDEPTIQQGIEAAQAGDRVLVAPGTYAERINFLGKAIEVIGTGGAAVTTIDGMRSGPVVTFHSFESRASRLAGFSIVHGTCGGADNGAGIFIYYASPTIEDNDIHDNGNRGCASGGIGATVGSPRVHRNRIAHNDTPNGPGAGLLYGDPKVDENVVEDNASGCCVGGLEVDSISGAVVARNIFRENSSYGLAIGGAGAVAHDNLVVANHYGGLWATADGGQTKILNNTLADNLQGEDLLAFEFEGGRLTVANNIIRTTRAIWSVRCEGPVRFRDNLVHASNGVGSDACDLAHGLVTGDPRFVGGSGPDAYGLTAGSPAIDVGLNKAVERIRRDITGGPRVVGGTVDLGAYEYRGGE
jgi:hypothetical protein